MIIALVQIMLNVGVRGVFQPPPTQKKRWLLGTALQCSQTTTASTNKHHQAQTSTRCIPWWGGGYPTNHLKAMTTIDPTFHTKLISSSKRGTMQADSKRKEPKRLDGRRLNQKRTEIIPPHKPTHLPPSHHDAQHPNCQKKAVGPKMTDKTSLVSTKRSRTRQTKRPTRRNSTKLDETRRRRRRNKNKLH